MTTPTVGKSEILAGCRVEISLAPVLFGARAINHHNEAYHHLGNESRSRSKRETLADARADLPSQNASLSTLIGPDR